jgi:hypothetical protein
VKLTEVAGRRLGIVRTRDSVSLLRCLSQYARALGAGSGTRRRDSSGSLPTTEQWRLTSAKLSLGAGLTYTPGPNALSRRSSDVA